MTTLALALCAFSNFVLAGTAAAERRDAAAIANFFTGLGCALTAVSGVA